MKNAARVALVLLFGVALATFGMWKFAPGFLEGGRADFPAAWPPRALCHWDCWWYGDIAANGYWYKPGEQSPVAYFPLYPMTMRAVAWVLPSVWWAGVFVTFLCGLFALVLFRRWAEQLKPGSGEHAQWLLLLYPWAVYLCGVVYSDALYLLVAVGAFYCLERRWLWPAVALGALATLCRPVAPAIVLGLTVRQLELKRRAGEKIGPLDFAPVLAACGFIGWMIFLQQSFGDPLAFVHTQSSAGWEQTPGPQTWFKYEFFRTVTERWRPGALLKLGSQGLVALGVLALAWPTGKKLGWGYAVYLAAVIGLPLLSSKDFQGLGRYAIAGFPAFLTLSLLLTPKPWLYRGWLAVSALAWAALCMAFGADVYIA